MECLSFSGANHLRDLCQPAKLGAVQNAVAITLECGSSILTLAHVPF